MSRIIAGRIARAALAALALTAAPALAENYTTADTPKSVDEAVADLRAEIERNGGTVFATVDHAANAETVDMDLDPATVVIFGNPRLGTPPMQDDILAGLYLPLRVLVYEGRDGGTLLAYENPQDMFDETSVPYDADYIDVMRGALERIVNAAAATD